MTYEAAHTYLLSLPRFAEQGSAAFRPGLDRMRRLLAAMNDPQQAFACVHVAGTNGKGSTASMLAAIATAAGHRVGLHTSPHLWHLAERMRVDGVPAPEAWLAEAVARYRTAFDEVQASFFEATAALSLRYFADAGVDLAVVEVGLGGRLDATNVLVPCLALITSIGLDHTDLLGDSLHAIALEKAGIIKPGVPVLTSADQPDALSAIRETADARGAPFDAVHPGADVDILHDGLDGLGLTLRTPLRTYEALHLDLPGHHQATNALLAVRAAEAVLPAVQATPGPVYAGLGAVRRLAGLRGRLDVWQAEPLIVVDVGHNADGLALALAFVQARCGSRGRLYVLFGLMRDKDGAALARLLAEADATVLPVQLASARALSPAELTDLLQRHGLMPAPPVTVPEGLAWFQQQALPSDALLVTGSHQVVAGLPEQGFAALS